MYLNGTTQTDSTKVSSVSWLMIIGIAALAAVVFWPRKKRSPRSRSYDDFDDSLSDLESGRRMRMQLADSFEREGKPDLAMKLREKTRRKTKTHRKTKTRRKTRTRTRR